jgi:hypothetical protein
MAVCGSVDVEDEGGKEDMEAKTIHSDMTASPLLLMGPETVKRVTEIRNMKAVPN